MRNIQKYWWLWLVALVLLGSFGQWPYAYYQFLRWVVAGAAAYMAYKTYESDRKGWVLVFGLVAILFNPIAPFYLQRETWQLFDIAATLPFAAFPFTKGTKE